MYYWSCASDIEGLGLDTDANWNILKFRRGYWQVTEILVMILTLCDQSPIFLMNIHSVDWRNIWVLCHDEYSLHLSYIRDINKNKSNRDKVSYLNFERKMFKNGYFCTSSRTNNSFMTFKNFSQATINITSIYQKCDGRIENVELRLIFNFFICWSIYEIIIHLYRHDSSSIIVLTNHWSLMSSVLL